MTKITCVGLGLMGSALARAQLAAGHPITVWNRSPAKMAALTALGAIAAPSLAGAVAASPVLLICIDNYASAHALLDSPGPAGALAGRCIVNLTTGTPQEAADLSAWVTARGASYLDGAILCGPPAIDAGRGEILLSGEATAWLAAGPVLSCLAGQVRHVGPGVGDAAALDLAWLTMFYAQFVGLAHAARICQAQGIDLHEFMALFPDDANVRDLARIIRDADYHHPTATLQVWGDALARIQAQARQAAIPPDIPDFIAGYFQRAIAMGLGGQEALAIFKTLH